MQSDINASESTMANKTKQLLAVFKKSNAIDKIST